MTDADPQDSPPMVAQPRRRRRGLGSAAVIAVAAGGVGGGYAISASATSHTSTTGWVPHLASSTTGAHRLGGGAPGTTGTVESVDAATSSFTVKNRAGTTVTVDVSSSTKYVDEAVSSPSLT
ncbi:MAG: hypothetical protein JWM85_3543, partial [Acidimicrobiaceae bacterium]|nr:hypothetical protein [Acidimicrobiaceae bacterium]